MLSILIPTYNFDVSSLVEALLRQTRQLNIPFEIVIEDDASTEERFRMNNRKLVAEPEVSYYQNKCNLGRSKVRNHLAEAAQYPLLLIMDCDAGMKHPDFISKYIQFSQNDSHAKHPYVVLGGVAYREMLPDQSFRLRWKYGVEREQRSAALRNINPYQHFTPFNMLVSKEVFSLCRFDESLDTYGFEDTLFGEQLQQLNIPVFHVDNELYHDGIDSNEGYLQKVESSISNLLKLYAAGKLSESFVRGSRLLQTYYKLKRLRLIGLACLSLRVNKRLIRWMTLQQCSLKCLDLYKLWCFLEGVRALRIG